MHRTETEAVYRSRRHAPPGYRLPTHYISACLLYNTFFYITYYHQLYQRMSKQRKYKNEHMFIQLKVVETTKILLLWDAVVRGKQHVDMFLTFLFKVWSLLVYTIELYKFQTLLLYVLSAPSARNSTRYNMMATIL